MLTQENIYKQCKECNQVFMSYRKFKNHLKYHNLSLKAYYDKHFKQENDDVCVKCKSEILFSDSIRYSNLDGNKLLFIGYRKLCKKCSIGVTLENLKIKYGDEIGEKKWNVYCEKQKQTMTFEYWNKKTGMSIEEYEVFNKRYGRSLENFIEKYGEEEGTKKYNETIDNIKYTQSKEYYKEKYGEEWEEKWNNVCASKSQSLQACISRDGEEEGIKKYLQKIEKSKPYVSEMSQDLFDMIYNEMYVCSDGIYYARLNKEFGKMYNQTYYFYDFVDSNKKKVIEFNGECFHARSPDDLKYYNFRNPTETAKDAFERDLKKREAIESFGFEVLYVWENDYEKDKERVKEECIKFLLS